MFFFVLGVPLRTERNGTDTDVQTDNPLFLLSGASNIWSDQQRFFFLPEPGPWLGDEQVS
jgi:hypothetical protein